MAGLSRLDTAKSRLKINWTAGRLPAEEQLDAKTALKELAGSSNRPLLILRTPTAKQKKQKSLDELVDRSFKNEKVQLASQWFHCVRVGREVLSSSHPLHSLFRGKKPPRVVLASWAGNKVVTALGSTKQKLDWKDLTSVLRVDYKKSPNTHVKQLQRLLNDFDKIDGARKNILAQLQRAEAKGKGAQVKKLRHKLARVDKDLAKALEREKKYRDLGRRAPKTD